MFENTKQLHEAMREILDTVRQDKDITILSSKYPDDLVLDLVEAINSCVSAGYLTGISCTVGAQNDVIINTSAPHITASGSEFISEN